MRCRSLILSLIVGGSACGSTDHVVGSLLGTRAPAGASGAANGDPESRSDLAGAAGDGGSSEVADGGTAGVGGTLDCAPDADDAECIPSRCGDGIESAEESCDDGNNVDGDGCSAKCTWEPLQGTPTAPPYGSAVAISGDTIVTGPFVFRLLGSVWALGAKLAPSAPGGGHDPFDDPSNSTFANAAAISGDTIAIGTQNDSEAGDAAGAVHIFQRAGSAWVWQEKLLPTLPDGTHDGVLSGHFGWQLSFSGDTLVVGAQGDDDEGFGSGAVYVFRSTATGFLPEAKLVATLPSGAPDGEQYFHFGTSVGLSGDTLVAGSTGSIAGHITNAAAYVFERSGSVWSPRAKLLPTLEGDAAPADRSRFGAAVAIATDTIVVGDPGDGVNAGCAYVFVQGLQGWTATAKLQAPSLHDAGVDFGGATAISSARDLILIGSPSDSHSGYISGSGHVFKREGAAWTYDAELLAPMPLEPINPYIGALGSYVAISGEDPLLGSASASYLFRQKNSSWDTRLVIPIADQ